MGSLLRISTPTVLPSSNRRSPLAVLGELRSAASESALKRLVIPAFVLILLKVVRVEGFILFLVFFSCRHRVRLGHRDLANFLRAVAEACSPQRFREENAVVRFISLS